MKALLTCSGISNTGRLTTSVAIALIHRKPGEYDWVTIKNPLFIIKETAESGETTIVVEGCQDCCATKKLTALGMLPDIHVIVTDLGIPKSPDHTEQWADIEKVIDEIGRAKGGKGDYASGIR